MSGKLVASNKLQPKIANHPPFNFIEKHLAAAEAPAHAEAPG